VLIYGLRGTTGVGAMDITNPDPSLVNTTDDFRYLWDLTSSNTSPAMGASLGATIATPNASGVAIIASATSGAASGVNVYMVKIADGSVLASTTASYTKSLPTVTSSSPIPNSAPPLPTVLDTSNPQDGDDLVLVPTPQGDVLSVNISSSGFTGTSPYYTRIFDASASAGCTTACQPFGSSVSVAKRLTTGDFIALAASGGMDWASTSSSQRYNLYGMNPKATTTSSAIFSRSLGTLATPLPFSTSTQTLPLRAYAQPTIAGSDTYLDGTTLSMGNTTQLLNPVLYGGVWGEGIRFGLTTQPDNTTVSAASYLAPVSSTYGGGYGSAMVTNNGGTVVEVGSSGVLQHKLTTSESASSTSNLLLKMVSVQSRTFKVVSWFQLGD
jgi:hypothetical protein